MCRRLSRSRRGRYVERELMRVDERGRGELMGWARCSSVGKGRCRVKQVSTVDEGWLRCASGGQRTRAETRNDRVSQHVTLPQVGGPFNVPLVAPLKQACLQTRAARAWLCSLSGEAILGVRHIALASSTLKHKEQRCGDHSACSMHLAMNRHPPVMESASELPRSLLSLARRSVACGQCGRAADWHS